MRRVTDALMVSKQMFSSRADQRLVIATLAFPI